MTLKVLNVWKVWGWSGYEQFEVVTDPLCTIWNKNVFYWVQLEWVSFVLKHANVRKLNKF